MQKEQLSAVLGRMGKDDLLTELSAGAPFGGASSADVPRPILRRILHRVVTGGRTGADYNLLFVSQEGGDPATGALGTLDALLGARDLRPREGLHPQPVVLVWSAPGGLWFLTTAGSHPVSEWRAEVETLAREAAQFVYPAGDPAVEKAAPALTPTVEDVHRFEGCAVRHAGLLLELHKHVLGPGLPVRATTPEHFARLAAGPDRFERTGRSSRENWLALADCHCDTNSYSNDFIAFLARLFTPPSELPACSGVLGAIDANRARGIAAALDRDGYYIFEERLPEALCDRLLEFALTHPFELQGESKPKRPKRARYDRRAPLTERYGLDEKALMRSPDAQQLMCDPSILTVSRAYLGADPVLELQTMWWITAVSGKPSDFAAQLYHFDMHRVRFLKWFVYLTDVSRQTGPHCLVRGSHRRGAKPRELLHNEGFGRITDEALARHYGPEDRVEICGPRGTIMAVDTRAYHKARVPETGDRLMFQVQFASGTFGNPRYITTDLGADTRPELLGALRAHPVTYQFFRRADQRPGRLRRLLQWARGRG
jgi:hypothetical protein